MYAFDKGVILYLLGRVDADLVHQHEYEEFLSPEAHERMMAENPLNLHVRPELSINDQKLRPSGSTGITWMPQGYGDLENKWVLQHYELDVDSAWQIHRIRFFWPACGRMEINKMSMTMIQESVSVSGTHFETPLEGERVILSHPQTGKEYTLYIDEIKKETADFSQQHDERMDYPACYTKMTYRIEPDMTRDQFRSVDCAQSDQPRYKEGFKRPEYQSAVAFGIIGGASGPVTLVSRHAGVSAATNHMATSSLHFEPVETIEWRIVFQEKSNEDLTVSLI